MCKKLYMHNLLELGIGLSVAELGNTYEKCVGLVGQFRHSCSSIQRRSRCSYSIYATRATITELAKDLGLHTSMPYRPWLVDEQVAGWTQVYGEMLTFATIRGGSHMAPFSAPKRSLALFSSFLAGKKLIALYTN